MADTFEQWWDRNWPFIKDTMRQTWRASQNALLCECKERLQKDCPGSFEQGCDLGNNAKYARVWKGK